VAHIAQNRNVAIEHVEPVAINNELPTGNIIPTFIADEL
jgi:hypothetical protein